MKKQYTEQDIIDLQALIRLITVASLNEPIKCDNDTIETVELGNMIVDNSPGPNEMVEQLELNENLIKYVKKLKPREEFIIMERYGLSDGKFKTLEDVGKMCNVSRERVRQVEAKALKKLRWLIMVKGRCHNIENF